MLRNKLKNQTLIFDGAIGTQILKENISLEDLKYINTTNPNLIKQIHLSYINAGSEMILANTFELNQFKIPNLDILKQNLLKALDIANSVKLDNTYVLLDVTTTGRLLEPMGTLTFEEAYNAYKYIVEISKDRCDGIYFETFTDIKELRIAILAAKDSCDLPILTSMTFEKNNKTLTGSSAPIVASILTGLNVDAIGVNCSNGPKQAVELLKEMEKYTNLPLILKPNASIPILNNNQSHFTISEDEFVKEFKKSNASIIGGCCGTTPDYIRKLKKLHHTPRQKKRDPNYIICSSTKQLDFNNIIICGERINPNGNKLIKQAYETNNMDRVKEEVLLQENNSAHILDINAGFHNETKRMIELITSIETVSTIPLQIDSSNYETLEQGAKYYTGITVLNSVSGTLDSMSKIFPIAKKYGCFLICLLLDENGIPKTAKQRIKIANKIISTAKIYNIPKGKLIFDPLVLTASTQQEYINQTLLSLEMLKKQKLHTTLGISNVSHGLPNRNLLNKNFLIISLSKGLNYPIVNPLSSDIIDTINSYKVLYNIDNKCENFISIYSNQAQNIVYDDLSIETQIAKGLKSKLLDTINELLNSQDALTIINNIIIPQLIKLGELFEKNIIFLPQLMTAAQNAKFAIDYLNTKIEKTKILHEGYLLIATVKGDIHDIGKNIIKTILESFGYNLIDLGKDVSSNTIIKNISEYKPKAILLSALMTTTIFNMKDTISELKQLKNCPPIIVGGAVLTNNIAKQINADYYAKDALGAYNILKKLNI